MAHATMRQVINELSRQGHKVTYYERKDGGVLIKSIDGMRFTGGTGNMYGRALVGERLSEKRATQISKITWTGERAKSQIEHKDIDIKKKLKDVQRKWNKAFKKSGMIEKVGRKTAKKVKWSIEHRGREETIRLLNEAEKYASGKAYSKNIAYLVSRIKDYVVIAKALQYSEKEVQPLVELWQDVEDNAWMIDEESLYPAYDALYKLNDGESPQEVARNTRVILKLPPR